MCVCMTFKGRKRTSACRPLLVKKFDFSRIFLCVTFPNEKRVRTLTCRVCVCIRAHIHNAPIDPSERYVYTRERRTKNQSDSRSKGLLVPDWLNIVSAKGTRPDPTASTCLLVLLLLAATTLLCQPHTSIEIYFSHTSTNQLPFHHHCCTHSYSPLFLRAHTTKNPPLH